MTEHEVINSYCREWHLDEAEFVELLEKPWGLHRFLKGKFLDLRKEREQRQEIKKTELARILVDVVELCKLDVETFTDKFIGLLFAEIRAANGDHPDAQAGSASQSIVHGNRRPRSDQQRTQPALRPEFRHFEEPYPLPRDLDPNINAVAQRNRDEPLRPNFRAQPPKEISSASSPSENELTPGKLLDPDRDKPLSLED